jgi:hypothetical protein
LILTVLRLLYDFLSLKNVASKRNKKKKILNHDENSRIRIRKSEVRIRAYGSVPKCHESATLVWKVAFKNLAIFFRNSPDSGYEAVLQTQPFVQPEFISEEKKNCGALYFRSTANRSTCYTKTRIFLKT